MQKQRDPKGHWPATALSAPETYDDREADFSRRLQGAWQALQKVSGDDHVGEYEQQLSMYENGTHRVAERIVIIHPPHVKPIVWGKEMAKVEFGSKINVSLVDGYAFLDHLSWEPYSEGGYLIQSVELYKQRHGYYPAEVMGDRIYCNRENRRNLKEFGIRLVGKQLGRPSGKNKVDYDPDDRNPIEGKFGQGKVRYGMDWTKAKLKDNSESWVAMFLVVIKLVRLATEAPYFWVLS